jgi:surface carbohydrate biosynthesis protein
MSKVIYKPIFFLPIECTPREFDYKLNLTRYFCNKGFDVIIGNPPFIRDELKFKNYRAVFLEKGLNPDPNYYLQLSGKGIHLYDLGDEGAANPVYSITYQPAVDSLKCMRAIFLWGEAQKVDLIKRNPDEDLSKKYKLLGNPAFDLCTFKYREFYNYLRPKGLPQSYILVNTNFGSFNSYNIDEQLKACTLISPMSLQMMRESYAKEEKQFSVFREWLKDIIETFPNETFVIRPHPTEIQENYKKLFGHYNNVVISKEGNANQAIAPAKIVLHKDCSTALQSYLMGVPVISLGSPSLNIQSAQWTLAFGALPENLEQAKYLINKILLNKKWDQDIRSEIDKRAKKILDSYFCNVGDSTKELVDFIVKDAESLLREQKPYKLIDSRSKVQKLKLFIRKFMPLYYKVPKAARETLVKYTKQDILTRLSFFEVVDPLGIDLNVKKVFPNAFMVSIK